MKFNPQENYEKATEEQGTNPIPEQNESTGYMTVNTTWQELKKNIEKVGQKSVGI